MKSSATLVLIRHGQIEANVSGHWHGSIDSPLTAEGRRQAERTGSFLAKREQAIKAIYTSPLERTRHTAHAIQRHHDIELHEEPELREYGIGELEGKRYLDLHREHRFFQHVAENPHYAPHGGESLLDVAVRMSESMLRIAKHHSGEAVVIVSHGAAMGIALAHFLDAGPQAWTNYQVSNCSVSELVLHPQARLLTFNETTHL